MGLAQVERDGAVQADKADFAVLFGSRDGTVPMEKWTTRCRDEDRDGMVQGLHLDGGTTRCRRGMWTMRSMSGLSKGGGHGGAWDATQWDLGGSGRDMAEEVHLGRTRGEAVTSGEDPCGGGELLWHHGVPCVLREREET